MDVLVIAVVAAFASALTLFSGFGLGTILLPAFALFFPAPVAVAATGAVHLLNNVFKGALLWKRADLGIVLRFGICAVPAANRRRMVCWHGLATRRDYSNGACSIENSERLERVSRSAS